MKEFVKSFFTSQGKPQPIYFWATLFLGLIFCLIVVKVIIEKKISDMLMASLVGLVIALITIYNIFHKTGGTPPNNSAGGQ